MAGNLSYTLLINALIKLLSNEQLKDIPDDILVGHFPWIQGDTWLFQDAT